MDNVSGLWKGLGVWREWPIEGGDASIESWYSECELIKLWITKEEDGTWTAALEDSDTEKTLVATTTEEAKKEAMTWIADILRAGVSETGHDPSEIRFKQFFVFSQPTRVGGQLPVLFGLTEEGIIYRSQGDDGWRRENMKLGTE